MKLIYEAPIVETVTLSNEDILASSGGWSQLYPLEPTSSTSSVSFGEQ